MGNVSTSHNPHRALLAAAASVITVVVLIALKAVIYVDSGAASVLASLVDSLLDVTVSLMTFMAIRFSLKPADATHRHGHGKIEGLAALFQACLITIAGFFLLWEAAHRFYKPHPVSGYEAAIGVMIASIVLSALLVIIQNHTLKQAPSLAVEADRAHYSTDIAINAGVIAVLLALKSGAPLWIDPAFAVLVALYLAVTIIDIARKGIDMLLDRELPENTRQRLYDLAISHEGVLGVHDLRAIMSGMKMLVSFDLEADGNLPLKKAHDIARRVEKSILGAFPNAEVMIHLDPHGDPHDSRHGDIGIESGIKPSLPKE